MISKFEKKEFLKKSAEIGKNILYVQGSGGNTSIKIQNKLFIKASGFELKDAYNKNIFVNVDYKKVIEGINSNKKDLLTNTWENSGKLRPSIETSLHALMPYKYVMHLHCINSLSWLVQKDFKIKILRKINCEDVSIIPYFTPGKDLTMAIKKTLSCKINKILLLANHGIVVSDDNLEMLLKNLERISSNLFQKVSNIKKANFSYLEEISEGTPFRTIKCSISNQIALSKYAINYSIGGFMFPDQVVFLSNGFRIINSKEDIQEIYKSKKDKDLLPILIIPNQGILVPRSLSNKTELILKTLAMIINRIPPKMTINYLSEKEVSKLSKMESEIYRKNL